jgi:hypothetical protein
MTNAKARAFAAFVETELRKIVAHVSNESEIALSAENRSRRLAGASLPRPHAIIDDATAGWPLREKI